MGALFAVALLFLSVLAQDVPALPAGGRLGEKTQRRSHAYQFEYETEDGSRRQEVGTFVYKDGGTEPILHVKGMYSYFGRDGRKYVIHYEADDNGSKTRGDFVPPFTNTSATRPSLLVRYLKSTSIGTLK